jgi:hypothetical protein
MTRSSHVIRIATTLLLSALVGVSVASLIAAQAVRDLRQSLEVEARRREAVESRVRELTDVKGLLELEVYAAKLSYADTRQSLKEKEAALATLEARGVHVKAILANAPVPRIDARVAAVRLDGKPALVLLSAGSDDQVEKGFEFSVYRGSDFVARVLVEKVQRDSCGCSVIFTREGDAIRVGDSAATRFD